ncbi:MAG TPA: NUDIX hydrolase [Anaerolineales bacterium]|nr:NUDIX hydrolase [Anaerolineales bacterium]
MIEILESRKPFAGRAFDVRQDKIRLPGGQTTQIDIVEHVDSVGVIPLDAQGLIWFVRQYRHPAERNLLELPAGTLNGEEAPQAAALRETREEIGMAAASLEEIGVFYLAPGYSTELMHVFLARELSPDPLPQDEDELLTIEKYTAAEAFNLAARGEIMDAKSLAALLLAYPLLGL